MQCKALSVVAAGFVWYLVAAELAHNVFVDLKALVSGVSVVALALHAVDGERACAELARLDCRPHRHILLPEPHGRRPCCTHTQTYFYREM